jgi:Protein of unknown function (DUF4238)
MSGRKQHHIPQSVLRAFETPSKGKKIQVWVFSKRNKFKAPVDDVAAERHFYSELSTDGTKTLDDLITDYENGFTSQISSLRSVPVGASADAATAAEVIAHLTIRNAHLRNSFSGGMRLLVEQATDLFCDEKNIRTLFGIDGKAFSPAMTAQVDEELANDPRFAATGLPRELLQKISFMAMKENFSRFVTNSLPSMQIALVHFASEAPSIMRKGQNKALSAGLAPDARTTALSKFHWTVRQAPEGGLVLPDCVALGIEGASEPQPLIMSDLDKLDYVLMPLTPAAMLIGSRTFDARPALERFNYDAAACSHEFVVSNRDRPDRDELVALLGSRSQLTIEDAIKQSFEGFKNEYNFPTTTLSPEVTPPADPQEGSAAIVSTALNYQVSFHGIADEATARRIAAVLDGIVRELRPMMALDRLDGFTFAEDYEGALRDLDRGFETNGTLKPTKQDYGVGVAMTPIVSRDGVIKSRVVARMWIATGIVSEGDEAQQIALHMIISQLAHVACIQLLDEALPGFFMSRLEDSLQAFLYPCVDSAWSGYFAARASAIFDPNSELAYRELTLSALQHAFTAIPAARLEYRFDGDMDKLMAVALPAITALLGHIGHLLGHCDGVQRMAFDDEQLEAAFENAGLRAWVDLFHGDLATIWDRRGQWSSIEEFFLLNRHAERLLWVFGIFPWKTDEGLVWIKVPYGDDTLKLQGLRPFLKGVWLRAVKYFRRMFSRPDE